MKALQLYQLNKWELAHRTSLKKHDIRYNGRWTTLYDTRTHATIDLLVSNHPELKQAIYQSPNPLEKPKLTRKHNPELVAFELSHNCRVYGYSVTKKNNQWQCHNASHSSIIYAATLNELLSLAPHAYTRKKGALTKPKKRPINPNRVVKPDKPSTGRTKGRPVAMQDYEKNHNTAFKGHNVRLAHNQWTCLNATKTETLTFDSLESLVAACPFVLSP